MKKFSFEKHFSKNDLFSCVWFSWTCDAHVCDGKGGDKNGCDNVEGGVVIIVTIMLVVWWCNNN